MPEQTTPDTRSRILATALELFARQGYQRTSLRQIAERLGVTKAAVLYHFAAKDDILATLTRPLIEDLEALLAHAELLDPDVARRVFLEGMLDAFLAHRPALLMLRHDLSILTRKPKDYERFFEVATRGNRVISGPRAGLAERIRAAQAIAMLGDPVILFPEVPAHELRPIILDGVHRLLSGPGGEWDRPARRPPGAGTARRAGRPAALDGEKLAEAQRMLAAGRVSVTSVAAQLGVSRATLYRHLGRVDDRL